MNGTDAKVAVAPPATRNRWRLPLRITATLTAIVLVGLLVRQVSMTLERNPRPAGFARGVLQGAMMPIALPNLLVGNDVTIYAEHNTGVPYKLGYTVGVNIAGAFFFGMFFVRINRWRKRRNGG